MTQRRQPTLVLVLATACVAVASLSAQLLGLRPLDASSPIGYAITQGRPRTGYRAADRQLAEWALGDWQRAGGARFTLREAPEADARILVNWADPADGQYGEMRDISVHGQHGAAIFIRPDVRALGDDIAARASTDALLRDVIVYLTCVHELGHALGLSHTRDERDVMYFFGYGGDVPAYFGRYRAKVRARRDLAVVSALSANDVAQLHAFYGAPSQ